MLNVVLRLVKDDHYRSMAPGLPWDAFYRKSQQQMSSNRSVLSDGGLSKEELAAVLESCQAVFQPEQGVENPNIRWLWPYYEMEYNCGFASLWTNRDRIDPTRNIRSFVFTIARNKALNHLSALRTRLTDPLEKDSVALSIESLSSEHMISRIDAMDLKRIIDLVYEKMPEITRKIFIMNRDENMTYEEIAESTGLSVKKVEYNMVKALKQFRNKLSIFK